MQLTTPNKAPTINIDELTITLHTQGAIPVLINPDFLLHNGIVERAWAIELPVIIESRYAQVSYTNGLSLIASEDRFIISQVSRNGHSLNVDEIVCPEVLVRYLSLVPPAVGYNHIQVEPVCSITMNESEAERLISPLHELKKGLPHVDVIPEMQVRLLYFLPDKSISLQVTEHRIEEGSELPSIRFVGRISRQVRGDTLPEQAIFIVSVVEEQWRQDIHDLLALTRQFYSKYTRKED